MNAVSRTRTTDKRFYGVVQGIVTNVEDSDGKEGRVKVRFDWFDEQMETEWCRVRQFYAGNGYGSFFIPEVGDEVLVAFVHGDMRMPIILGALYNGVDKPVTYRSSSRDQKLIRTKAQHELLFDDSSGKERVRIKTNGGHSADLSDCDKKVTVQTTGGQSVTLDDSANTITLQTGANTVTIDNSSGTITVSGTNVVINAASVSLGASVAPFKLVQGDLLLALFNTHTHLCTAPGAPSSPPVVPLLPTDVLSMVCSTV